MHVGLCGTKNYPQSFQNYQPYTVINCIAPHSCPKFEYTIYYLHKYSLFDKNENFNPKIFTAVYNGESEIALIWPLFKLRFS